MFNLKFHPPHLLRSSPILGGTTEKFKGLPRYSHGMWPKKVHFSSLISYIFFEWVISDVSFGFTGGFGSCNIRLPRSNDPVGIDLIPTRILAAIDCASTQDKWPLIYWSLLRSKGNRRGVMANTMDCDIVVSEFEHQSRYYVLLCNINLNK